MRTGKHKVYVTGATLDSYPAVTSLDKIPTRAIQDRAHVPYVIWLNTIAELLRDRLQTFFSPNAKRSSECCHQFERGGKQQSQGGKLRNSLQEIAAGLNSTWCILKHCS